MTEPRPSGGVAGLIRNGLYLASSQGAMIVFRLALMVLVTRLLGPALYGSYVYATSWYVVALPLTYLGLGVVLIREVGARGDAARDIVHTTLALRWLVTWGVMLLVMVAGWWTGEGKLVALASLALVGRGMAAWVQQCLIAYEKGRLVAGLTLVGRVAELAGAFWILTRFDGWLSGLVGVHVLSWTLVMGLGLALVHRRIQPLGWRLRWQEARGLLAEGIPISLFSFGVHGLGGLTLILYRAFEPDAEAYGQFALALTVYTLLAGLFNAAVAGLLPALSRRADATSPEAVQAPGEDQDGRGGLLAPAVALMGILALAAIWGGQVLGGWFVPWLLGARYAVAGELLGTTLWILLGYAPLQPVLQAVFAHRKVRAAFAGVLVHGAVSVIMLAVAASRWGSVGVIAVCTVAYVLLWLVLLAWLEPAALRALAGPGLHLGLTALGFVLLEPWSPAIALVLALGSLALAVSRLRVSA